MRIMDCVLILFQRRLDLFAPDPERPSPKPSWAESLKVIIYADNTLKVDVFILHKTNGKCFVMSFFYLIS